MIPAYRLEAARRYLEYLAGAVIPIADLLEDRSKDPDLELLEDLSDEIAILDPRGNPDWQTIEELVEEAISNAE